jgi:hypothetical protein
MIKTRDVGVLIKSGEDSTHRLEKEKNAPYVTKAAALSVLNNKSGGS